jgi:hypothetical protein
VAREHLEKRRVCPVPDVDLRILAPARPHRQATRARAGLSFGRGRARSAARAAGLGRSSPGAARE